jgi:hypothetical protein
VHKARVALRLANLTHALAACYRRTVVCRQIANVFKMRAAEQFLWAKQLTC